MIDRRLRPSNPIDEWNMIVYYRGVRDRNKERLNDPAIVATMTHEEKLFAAHAIYSAQRALDSYLGVSPNG